MDIEQLKLILETINSMGGDAKEFGIWWMAATAVPSLVNGVLLFVFGLLCVTGLCRVFKQLIRALTMPDAIADAVGCHVSVCWGSSDKMKVMNRIHSLVETEKKYNQLAENSP